MASIQGVYVALFGRPADPTGLAYFNSITNGGQNLAGIANLAGTAEYQSRFTGLNNVQIINSIYQSLFGRDADLAGLNFFADALSKGTLNINNIAIAILDGAQGNDKTIVTNKVNAADAYTKALDTGAEVVAYSGNAAIAQGVAFLKTVTTTAPTSAQVDAAVATMVSASTSGGTGTTGVTLTLTDKADTIGPNVAADASKTTAGNDTIRAVLSTDLGTTDSIDGGAGTDTLNANMVPAGGLVAGSSITPVLKNVELVNLTYAALPNGAAVTFNAKDATGIQKLTVDSLSVTTNDDGAGGTAARSFTVDQVEKSTVVELKNINVSDNAANGANGGAVSSITGIVNVNFRDADGSADTATVSLSKATVGAAGTNNTAADVLNVNVAKIETLTVNSTGTASADNNTVKLTAAQTQKLVITGDKDLTLTNDTNAVLKNVDASALTGKLNYTATTNGETILGGTKADTINITGGTNGDTIVYNASNASTLQNMDTITGFQAGTNTTAVDKFDIKAFNLASTSTYAAASFKAVGDNVDFFKSLGSTVKIAGFYDGNDTYVYIDANNNGNFESAADAAIKITGNVLANLDKSDFILA